MNDQPQAQSSGHSLAPVEADLETTSRRKRVEIEGRLAVCSWSLQPTTPDDLVAKTLATGIRRVQLALVPLREMPAVWSGIGPVFESAGIKVVSGMFSFSGENYATLETIRKTGGIAPDATWNRNLETMGAAAELSGKLGLGLVTFHAGFLPQDETDPAFLKMLERLRKVAAVFGAKRISVGLETGQENPQALATLLERLDCPNVGVNFDPANMILYGKGDPIEGVRVLAPWVRQVHIKDANPAKVPGTWGEEVVVGSGSVDWRRFFRALKETNFSGDLVIEREAGAQRVTDMRAAREVVMNSIG